MAVYITGDTHGDFHRIQRFCDKASTSQSDTLIILGDSGINYYVNQLSTWKKIKNAVKRLPITVFCIHGNHEERAENLEGYEQKQWFNGKVLVDPEYPNIKFAIDGEVYKIPTSDGAKSALVCGGAYSVDKYYRLIRGYNWFESEQPSDEIKNRVEDKLMKLGNSVDIILTHTCPYSYRPVDMFLPGIDQSKVDSSTELWFETFLTRGIKFEHWYCGHYHIDRDVNSNFTLMFNQIRKL